MARDKREVLAELIEACGDTNPEARRILEAMLADLENWPMTRPLDVVGLVELAELLGAERATVRMWYHRGKLPEPDAVLAATPVWRHGTISEWAEDNDLTLRPR